MLRCFWLRPRVRGAAVGYEKAGLRVANEPIPWNAELVVVEVVLATGPLCAGAKADFQLVNAEGIVAGANSCEREGQDGQTRVSFRFAPLQCRGPLGLTYRGSWLGQILLACQTQSAFLLHLLVDVPTMFTRLSGQCVPCQAMVERQSEGLLVAAVLRSPTALLPLIERGLTLELVGPEGGVREQVAVPLASFQFTAQQAVLSVPLSESRLAAGTWQVRWRVGDAIIAIHTFRVVAAMEFQQSLYVIGDGLPRWESAQAAERGDACGFQFSVASQLAGVAARFPVEIHLYYKDGTTQPVVSCEDLLIADVPALGAPIMVTITQADRVEEFGVSSQGWFLGTIARQSAPVAQFTSEGGIESLPEYVWTPVMDAELNEQLNKLMHCPTS
jgi:hypothetical protein